MRKMWAVALREYLFNLRRPSFLFAVFGVPLFTFFMWFVIFAVVERTENNVDDFSKVGYIDQSGILDNAIPLESAPDMFIAFPTTDAARQALDDKTIGAYFVLGADYLGNGSVETYSYTSIPRALKSSIGTFIRTQVVQQMPGDIPLDRITNPVNLVIHATDTGRDLTEANAPALILMPMIFAMVFIMASGVTSGFLMNGVVEEKTNRVMEILVTSITPVQLLAGKIIGLGALGLTQLVVWGGAGAILINVGQEIPLLKGIVFPTDMAVLALVYFTLSYFLIASLMAGVGVIANSEQESRQYSTILSLIWVLPFFFIVAFIEDPNGVVPIALTLIPFTAPLSVLMRVGFSVVPAWQIVASLAILLLTTVGTTWLSARIFRWGMLRYGKRASLRDMFRAVRRAPQFTTTATTTGEKSS
ncbi:MAG: ABC transporter permease [Anaerolineae bacterium]|nr:ABC transporter permease [Anaerolineae bacterium]